MFTPVIPPNPAQRALGFQASVARPRGARWLAIVSLTVVGAFGCGGKSFLGGSGADSSGSPSSSTSTSTSTSNGSGGTGASASTSSGGSSGSGGSGGTVSSSSAGGTGGGSAGVGGSGGGIGTTGGTGGAGGTLPDLCLEPIDPGPCDGSFPSYGFNPDSGSCDSFIYGGCEGNDNRFDTREACLDTCGPGGRTACTQPIDCVINHGCCGYCGIESVDQFEAVNQAYADYTDVECELINCDDCVPPPDTEQFGATCNAGSCELFDVRKSDLSACTSDDDCRLRSGLGCCEGCGDGNWVAVSADFEALTEKLCGAGPVPCPTCDPIEPQGLTAICGAEGHCLVSELDLTP